MISCPFAKAIRASNSFGVPPHIVVYCFSLRNRCKADLQRVHSHPTRIPGSAYALLIPARLIPSSYTSTMAGNLSLGSYSSRRSGAVASQSVRSTFRFQHINFTCCLLNTESWVHLHISSQNSKSSCSRQHSTILSCSARFGNAPVGLWAGSRYTSARSQHQ